MGISEAVGKMFAEKSSPPNAQEYVISTVRCQTGSIANGEHPSNHTPAVDDSSTEISMFGKWARSRCTRQRRKPPQEYTWLGLESFA